MGECRRGLVLVVATVGLGLNYLSWTLLSPLGLPPPPAGSLHDSGWLWLGAVIVAVSLVAGVPAGLWADRSRGGPGRVVAVLSGGSALAVLALLAVSSVSELVAVGVATAVTGTTFGAGGAAVLHAYPARRRGWALGVYGTGTAAAAACAVATRPFLAMERNERLLLLAAVLGGYAVVAWLALRRRRVDPPAHPLGAVLRTPAILPLSAWYAASFAGTVGFDLYLPGFLHRAYGIPVGTSSVYAAVCLGLAALGSVLGAWWCRRRPPVPLLTGCHAVAAAVLLMLAFQQLSLPMVGFVSAALAVSLGAVGGVVLHFVGSSVPAGQAAATLAVVRAIAGLAGLLPPLLLAAVDRVPGIYTMVMTLLAVLAAAAAVRVHRARRWIGAAVAFPVAVVPERETATTVVAVSARAAATRFDDVVRALSGLARSDELAVACAGTPQHHGGDLVTALRRQLPGYTVVAVATAAPPHPHELKLIGDLLNDGVLPVAVPPGANPTATALVVGSHVAADRVLSVTPHQTLLLTGHPAARATAPA